jgi:hypothetical protein
MTAIALANASAHAAVNVLARTFSSIRLAFSRLGAALARIQEARLEAEMRRIRDRIKRMDADDRPIIN